jgi:hypothetical protein
LKHASLVLSLNLSVVLSYCIIVLTFRDSKSYAKYSAVDSEIDQRVCQNLISSRVVLSDVLGSKDVVEGRDGRTDGRTRRIVIGRIRVKTELHA